MIGRLLLIIWLLSITLLIYFIYPVVWPKRNPVTGLNKLVIVKKYDGFAIIQNGYIGNISDSIEYHKSEIILHNNSGVKLSGLEAKSERFFITGYPEDIKTINNINYPVFAVNTWKPLSYVTVKETGVMEFFYIINNVVLIALSVLFLFKTASTEIPKF